MFMVVLQIEAGGAKLQEVLCPSEDLVNVTVADMSSRK